MTTANGDNQVIQLTAPSGLLIEAATTTNRVLDEFYRDYDAAFVLINEKESYAGFTECLELNSGEAYEKLVQQYGVFREFVVVIYDPESGVRIGGANFITFPLEAMAPASKPLLSINLNYIFINRELRNRGYFKQLIRDFPEIAFRLLLTTNPLDVPGIWTSDDFHARAERPQTLMFIEQNDPYRMSADDYQCDTKYTGLDQLERINIWTRLGAKIIDFPYVQPALTETQEAEHNLVLAVLGMDSNALDPCLLQRHLERFFGISVLKGSQPAQNPAAAAQLSILREACEQRKTLSLLSAPPLTSLNPVSRGASLRDVLRFNLAGASPYSV